jgi:hypothetical protein
MVLEQLTDFSTYFINYTTGLFNQFKVSAIDLVPGIGSFVLIVTFGYLVSMFSAFVIKNALYKMNLDSILRRSDLRDSLGRISLARLISIIVKWSLFTVFLSEGIRHLKLGIISEFLQGVAIWLPNLIASVVIVIVGLLLTDFISAKVLELKGGYALILSYAVKATLLIVVGLTAVKQLGINTSLVENIFLLVLTAVLLSASLAVGIGVGLGLKEESKRILRLATKKLK